MVTARTVPRASRVLRTVFRWFDRVGRLVEHGRPLLPAVAASGFLLALVLIVIAASLNDRYGAAIQDNFIATGHQSEALGDLVDLEDRLADATSSALAF